jgi:RNA polymerase-binding transcription factor DksA
MVLSTRRQSSVGNANTNIDTSINSIDTSIHINQTGSVGALKATPATEVLLTLRRRLQTQLESANAYGVPELHANTLANTHANLHTVRPLLDQVDSALSRIDQGKYGVCTDCSGPVEGHRMVMEPYSTRCTGCQAVADWRGLGY